jgi:hypothetical protein
MDRQEDLHYLYKIFSDVRKPSLDRKLAYKSFVAIQKQLKDKKLMSLRKMLLNASRANDKYNIWKYTQQINEHVKRERYDYTG